MTPSSPSLRAAIVCAALLASAPAHAQSYVRADCKPLIASRGPDMDSLTAHWYRRFWTGDCEGLRFCRKGSPNWNEAVGKLVARSRPSERSAVLARACRLGPLIGREWTRPRAVRRIDTDDLKGFNATLEQAGDVMGGLAKVEAQARAKIGGRPG